MDVKMLAELGGKIFTDDGRQYSALHNSAHGAFYVLTPRPMPNASENWREGEDHSGFIPFAKKYIGMAAKEFDGAKLLDCGSGEGKNLAKYSNAASYVIAVEPSEGVYAGNWHRLTENAMHMPNMCAVVRIAVEELRKYFKPKIVNVVTNKECPQGNLDDVHAMLTSGGYYVKAGRGVTIELAEGALKYSKYDPSFSNKFQKRLSKFARMLGSGKHVEKNIEEFYTKPFVGSGLELIESTPVEHYGLIKSELDLSERLQRPNLLGKEFRHDEWPRYFESAKGLVGKYVTDIHVLFAARKPMTTTSIMMNVKEMFGDDKWSI